MMRASASGHSSRSWSLAGLPGRGRITNGRRSRCRINSTTRRPSDRNPVADTKWFDLFQDDALKQLVTAGAGAKLRCQDRGRARDRSSRAIRHHASPIVPHGRLCPRRSPSQRTSAMGAFPVPARHAAYRERLPKPASLFTWEIDLWGRSAASGRSRARAISRDRRGAARRDRSR